MRVAAVQMAPIFKEKIKNIQLMGELLKEAVDKGAELVVFPELATSGYSFMSESDVASFAEPLDGSGPVVTHFKRLAALYDVAIVWGMPGSTPRGFTNSQVLVLPNGGYATYDKLNPWGNDYLWSVPGEKSPPIIVYKGKRIGLLICRDVRDKSSEIDKFYERGDADIIAFSSNFGDGAFPASAWMNFVKDNQMWLVVSNRYGRETCNNFGEGGICVIAPNAKVHCEGLVWDSPCVVVADIP